MGVNNSQREKFGFMKKGSLFVEMVLLTLSGLIIVSTVTLFITKRSVDRIYLDAMRRSGNQSLSQVQKIFESWQQNHSSVIYGLRKNWVTQSFLSIEDPSSVNAFSATYKMNALLNSLGLVDNEGFGLSLILTDAQGSVKRTYSYSGSSGETGDIPQEVRVQVLQPGGMQYTFLQGGLLNSSTEQNSIVMSKALNNVSTGVIYGYLLIMIPQEQLQRAYKSLSSRESSLILINEEGIVVSAENERLIGLAEPELLQVIWQMEEQNKESGEMRFHGRNISVVVRALDGWGLYAVALIDRQAALHYIGADFREILFFCMVVLAFMMVIIFKRIRYRFAPLEKLIERMEYAEKGDIFTSVDVQGGYEIRQLAGAYNHMILKANEYVDALVNGEKQKRELEIRTLRMQINPHFIYNTLASVKFLIRQKETEKAQEAIDCLILLMRNNISKNEELVTVEQELENVEYYGVLQRLRYGERIDLQINMQKELANCLIPKLILQPFIENAFFHAFPDELEGGMICVFVRENNTNLICEIIDNGKGFVVEQIKKVTSYDSGNNIGIQNVQDRLKLLYGAGYGVSISGKDGQGTIVTICLPKQQC